MRIQPLEGQNRAALMIGFETVVQEVWGPDQALAGVDCHRLLATDRAGTYRVRVLLEDQRTGDFLLKDLSWQDPTWRKGRGIRRRELRMYQDILLSLGLGTPRYYWSEWDETRGRFWLLLELVRGVPLTHRPWADWVSAVQWLGRLQGAFALSPHAQSHRKYLPRHSPAFFERIVAKAQPGIARLAPSLASRLERHLPRWDRLCSLTENVSSTIVHGEFRPEHILIAAGSELPRLAVIDWEQAAIGSPLYDVATLARELEPARRKALCAAYQEAARAQALPRHDPAEFGVILDYFFLLLLLRRLGKALAHGYDPKLTERWIQQAEQLLHSIQQT